MKVRIVQCLCPSRHCIMATAYQTLDGQEIAGTTDRVKAAIQILIETRAINPWCALCRSRDWHYEDAPTNYATMDEAMPHLEALAIAQQATALFLKQGRN